LEFLYWCAHRFSIRVWKLSAKVNVKEAAGWFLMIEWKRQSGCCFKSECCCNSNRASWGLSCHRLSRWNLEALECFINIKKQGIWWSP
jgi:hypothetical protein